MSTFIGSLACLIVALSLLHCASTQTITLTDGAGNDVGTSITLPESNDTLQYCINLDTSPTTDMTVSLAGSGFANVGDDYLLSQTTFTFLSGTNDLQQCFDLTILLDNRLEQIEFFTLSASSGSASDSVLVTIDEADTIEVGFDQTSYSIGEEEGSVSVCVVLLSATVFEDTVLSFAVTVTATGDTATVNDDFTVLGSNTVTLRSTTTNAGECVTISIESDLLVEGNENVNLTLTTALGTVRINDERGSAVLIIEDDEAATVEFTDVSLSTSEGDDGAMTAMDLCLELTFTGDALDREVVAQVDITGGTAVSGEDFSLASSMVTFDVSSSNGDMQCLEIMVAGDSDYESDETVMFGLTVTRTGQAGSTNSATLTIMNDDEAPTTTSAPTTPSSNPLPPSTEGVIDNRNRNIGIGIGVGVGGFLLILVVVILVAAVIIVIKNKRSSEKYVLNYSTVYGTGSSSSSDTGNNNYTVPPTNEKPAVDGGESGSNGINERPIDVGDDADESTAITFKEE